MFQLIKNRAAILKAPLSMCGRAAKMLSRKPDLKASNHFFKYTVYHCTCKHQLNCFPAVWWNLICFLFFLFSQSYHLQATREMHPSLALNPSTNYNSPKFRSRNQSYMRAVSTLSQASCVSQVSQVREQHNIFIITAIFFLNCLKKMYFFLTNFVTHSV